MNVPSADDHAEALKTLLLTTGIPGERGVKPDGAGWQDDPGSSTFVGYWVIHPIEGGVTSGPVGDANADTGWPYQVTCVGHTASQAEQIADVVATAVLTTPPAVPGRRHVRTPEWEMRGGARRDDTLAPTDTQYYATPRFRFFTTPA